MGCEYILCQNRKKGKKYFLRVAKRDYSNLRMEQQRQDGRVAGFSYCIYWTRLVQKSSQSLHVDFRPSDLVCYIQNLF